VRWDNVLQSGHRLCYLDAGPIDGEPIVLLHGLMSDSSTWDPAIGPLAEHGLRVIAPDLIGHGKSDKPRVRYGLDFFATSVSELLTALGIPRATVAGHSLGGAIAVYFARFHTAQLYRLVLVSDRPDDRDGVELGRLDRGDEVELLALDHGFAQVRAPDGLVGWIDTTTLEKPPD